MDAIELYQEPILKNPVMVAAWPGISNVALRATSYLKDKLGAEEFGEIKPFGFFSPAGVVIQDNVVSVPRFPESKFYYWKNRVPGNDVIIFISEAQPALKQYEFANLVLDVAQKFNVERIYTFAAAIIPHRAEGSKVWGAVTDAWLIEELKRYGVVQRGDYHIRGLNGLLLGVAKERGITAVCLLGETPQHFAEMENPRASLSVLQALIKMLGIDIDLGELEEQAERADEEMERLSKETMSQYIDHFTQPIWEREEEENE
jgi:uncharacterized protein (TIGR00162 family)